MCAPVLSCLSWNMGHKSFVSPLNRTQRKEKQKSRLSLLLLLLFCNCHDAMWFIAFVMESVWITRVSNGSGVKERETWPGKHSVKEGDWWNPTNEWLKQEFDCSFNEVFRSKAATHYQMWSIAWRSIDWLDICETVIINAIDASSSYLNVSDCCQTYR